MSNWFTHGFCQGWRHRKRNSQKTRPLLKDPKRGPNALDHFEKFAADIRLIQKIITLRERIVGDYIDGNCTKSMVEIELLTSRELLVCKSDELLGFRLDYIFQLQYHFPREEWIESAASDTVHLVVFAGKSCILGAEAVVKIGLGVFAADIIDALVIICIAQVDFIRRDTNNRA